MTHAILVILARLKLLRLAKTLAILATHVTLALQRAKRSGYIYVVPETGSFDERLCFFVSSKSKAQLIQAAHRMQIVFGRIISSRRTARKPNQSGSADSAL